MTIVPDHFINDAMEEMAISKFKATCLAVLERVRKTGAPVLVTRFGKPVAEIVPPRAHPKAGDWLGALKESGRIDGDVVVPAADMRDWEAAAPSRSGGTDTPQDA